MSKTFKYAFVKSIPILTGYLFLSFSYGVYGASKGLPAWLLVLMSVIVYGGSLQFAAVDILLSPFNPIETALLSFMISARHIFYGITMLEPYKNLGVKKPIAIFTLTDETFSVNATLDPPEDVDRDKAYFYISVLNHSYWIIGTIIGVWVGSNLTFNTEGIDFVLTALFVSIFTQQWLEADDKKPAVVGLVLSLVSLLIFGPDNFMIPAMILIIGFFLLEYKREGAK